MNYRGGRRGKVKDRKWYEISRVGKFTCRMKFSLMRAVRGEKGLETGVRTGMGDLYYLWKIFAKRRNNDGH